MTLPSRISCPGTPTSGHLADTSFGAAQSVRVWDRDLMGSSRHASNRSLRRTTRPDFARGRHNPSLFGAGSTQTPSFGADRAGRRPRMTHPVPESGRVFCPCAQSEGVVSSSPQTGPKPDWGKLRRYLAGHLLLPSLLQCCGFPCFRRSRLPHLLLSLQTVMALVLTRFCDRTSPDRQTLGGLGTSKPMVSISGTRTRWS